MRNRSRPLGYVVTLAACIGLIGWLQPARAQDSNIYDRIWAVPVLYKNADNSSIQSFSLIGRYHGQYWSVRADQGNNADWENRRKIVGFSSRWFQNFTVQAQMFLKTDGGSLYGGLYEGYIQWESPESDFSISAGRLDYLFTGYERSESSKRINAIERGLLVNQIMPAEVVGTHLEGKKGRFSYHAGWFSRSIEEEFDDFESGSAAVVGGGYDTRLFYEKGRLHLDYLYNPGGSEGNAFRPYEHVISLWHRGEKGRLGMAVDLTYAAPLESNGHVIGLTLEPTWILLNEVFGSNDSLQLAFRYQYADSNEDNGLGLQRRYEQKVTGGEGDHYQAFYTGLNYFLYGHKLKLMAGGEYARMKDRAGDGGEYRGWTWFGAVRLYF